LVHRAPAAPVELLLLDGTDHLAFTRYYDVAGNLTKRVTSEHVEGRVNNPVTGLSAINTQVAQFTEVFATPGDLSTATLTQRGVVKYFLPGAGVLFIDVGRAVVAPDGTALAESGKHPFDQFFSGDKTVFGQLCAALGSPTRNVATGRARTSERSRARLALRLAV
jgi:hypothetical protein